MLAITHWEKLSSTKVSLNWACLESLGFTTEGALVDVNSMNWGFGCPNLNLKIVSGSILMNDGLLTIRMVREVTGVLVMLLISINVCWTWVSSEIKSRLHAVSIQEFNTKVAGESKIKLLGSSVSQMYRWNWTWSGWWCLRLGLSK